MRLTSATRPCPVKFDVHAHYLPEPYRQAAERAVVDHPGRFGLLGSLPLPEADAAIAEIAHYVDHLDVDGFILLTNIRALFPRLAVDD